MVRRACWFVIVLGAVLALSGAGCTEGVGAGNRDGAFFSDTGPGDRDGGPVMREDGGPIVREDGGPAGEC